MAVHPTNNRRTRLYNIFVGGFFVAVMWGMLVAGVVARGDWTLEKIVFENLGVVLVTLIGVAGAIAYYRRGE